MGNGVGRRIKNREKRPRNQDSDTENSPLAAAARWQQETKQAAQRMLERARPPGVRERMRGSACTGISVCVRVCACKLIPSRGRQMGEMCL